MFMRSLITRGKVLLLFFLSFLLFLFFYLQRTTYQARVSGATSLLVTWDLAGAQDALMHLASEYPESLTVRRMYAECLLKRGELRLARAEYRFLIDADPHHRSSHLLALSKTQYFLGRLDSAGVLAREVLAYAIQHNNSVLIGESYHLLGRVSFDRASYDSALWFQRQSLSCAISSGSIQGQADALRQIGVLYWYSGKTDSACTAFYEPALHLYRQTNDRIGEATTLNNIGLATGDPLRCLQAFAIRKMIGDQIGLADSYYFVTSPAWGVRWNDRAYAFRLKSLQLSERIGYAWGRDVAARAVDQMVFGSYDSLSPDDAAADTTSTIGEAEIFRLQARAVALMRRRQLDESVRLRERVVFLCDSMGYTPGLGMALAQYADALIMAGQYGEAERAVGRLRTVWEHNAPAADVLLAKTYEASGRYASAAVVLTRLAEYYDQAYRDNLSQNSLSAAIGEGRILYSRFTVYEKLIDCYSRMNDISSLVLVMDRFRSITTVHGEGPVQLESLREPYNEAVEKIERGDTSVTPFLRDVADAFDRPAPLHSGIQDALAIINRTKSATLGEIQQALGPDEVVLDYFIGTEHAYVLAIRRDSGKQIRLSTPVRDINSSALTLHDLILRGQKAPDDTLWKGPAGFLYSSLLEPLGQTLQDGDHIIISPHGHLHGVPFGPLLDAQRRPAIERFRISIVRSAGDILRSGRKRSGTTALAVVPDRTSLRFTEQEVARIPQSLFTSRAVLMDEEATTTEFLRRAPEADLIHIAAHGMVDRVFPLFSQIQLWDGPLELHRIASLTFAARLILISACESGLGIGMLGDVSYGHVVVSFPYAFLAAGASTVLSPLWIIEDQTASHLVGLFYSSMEALDTRNDQAQRGIYPLALALAQRQVFREGVKSHPFYWAGFQLIGLVNG